MNRALSLAFVASFVSLSALGCASSQKGADDAHHHGEHGEHDHGGHEHGEHGEHGKHEKHAPFTGGMKAFHDVLAPAYHAEKGPARDDKTCGGVAAMKDAAGKIAGEPKGDAGAWKAKSDALAQQVDGLGAACASSPRGDVSAKLETVHDAFHALVEASK
jgi:hypothetical protein